MIVMATTNNNILPYPYQLPQDYYAKNVPPTPVVPPTVVTPPSEGSYESPDTINTGGAYYGTTPPLNPQNGWLWTDGSGALYVYTDPGVWQQIATNW